MTEQRIKRLLLSMEEQGIDGVLLNSPENMFYFSGFLGGTWGILVTKKELLLFTDSRYSVQAKEEAPLFLAEDTENAYKKINEVLPNGKTIALEEDYISARLYKTLKEKLSADVSPLGKIVRNIRAIKDKEEIRRIREAERLGDEAFSYILSKLKAGTRESEIAAHLEYFMRINGASRPSFETIVASGVRSAMPHGAATEKLLDIGDFVTLDFGCVLEGYSSDMTRTVTLGKANERQREIYKTVRSAQEAALSGVKPYMPSKEYDSLARDVITKAGYGPSFGHSLGHGVGLQIHEAPFASPRSEDILLPGMTVTCEPGIYIEGFGGVRIEDLIVIEEDGIINLSRSNKDLIEII